MTSSMFDKITRYRDLWSQPAYDSLERPSSDDELDGEKKHDEDGTIRHPTRRRLPIGVGRLILISLLCVTAGLGLGYAAHGTSHGATEASEKPADYCAVTPQRREWNSLSVFEKSKFIRAVRCMAYEPSKARPKGALFDDFPYVRAEFGRRTLDAASFLPWNRYFLHIFEKTLREECAFDGTIPYWSWTLNAKSLASASVFDKTLAFGGNGNPTASLGAASGHCVLDGSFSDLQLKFADSNNGSLYKEHCLSRAFSSDDMDGRLAGEKVGLPVIREIIDQADYASFLNKLEAGPMTAIPAWIGGDFSQLTGPNDPLFILHLAQLDRLWWMWQISDPFNRNEEYKGLSFNDAKDEAKLEDILTLGTYLAPDIKVDDVMATNYGGVVCYNYTLH